MSAIALNSGNVRFRAMRHVLHMTTLSAKLPIELILAGGNRTSPVQVAYLITAGPLPAPALACWPINDPVASAIFLPAGHASDAKDGLSRKYHSYNTPPFFNSKMAKGHPADLGATITARSTHHCA